MGIRRTLVVSPLVAVLAASGRPLSTEALGAAAVGFVLLAGAASRRRHDGRLSWAVPPLLRTLEYGILIRLTVLADRDAVPLCFALLGALAFHHYDTVYRLRHQRVAPPSWARAIGGGWDGRLLAAYILAAAGALDLGLLAAAVALALVYVTESTVSWLRFARTERTAVYEDEDVQDE